MASVSAVVGRGNKLASDTTMESDNEWASGSLVEWGKYLASGW